MFWQEDDKKDDVTTSDRVVDLSFRVDCKQLPTRHAWELSQALYKVLPWIQEDSEIGIHQIHGVASGNGWERPADGDLIHLSRRTRMNLRVPVERINEANELVGKTLDIAGYTVTVGQVTKKAIDPVATLFSRYVVVEEGMSEEEFLRWVVGELEQRDIQARKLLCGKDH